MARSAAAASVSVSSNPRARVLLEEAMARVNMGALANAAREYGDDEEETRRELADLEAGCHPLQRKLER